MRRVTIARTFQSESVGGRLVGGGRGLVLSWAWMWAPELIGAWACWSALARLCGSSERECAARRLHAEGVHCMSFPKRK